MTNEPSTPPKTFVLRLPPDLRQALDDEAERQDNRSLNNLILSLIRDGLKRANHQA